MSLGNRVSLQKKKLQDEDTQNYKKRKRPNIFLSFCRDSKFPSNFVHHIKHRHDNPSGVVKGCWVCAAEAHVLSADLG